MNYFFILCLIAPVFGAQPLGEDWTEPESPEASYLGLSAGASKVVPNIRATFTCIGRNYGYFADVDNNCQLFHVCHPSFAADGSPVIYHFTKFCPNQTRFDQQQLTCLSVDDPKLIPCSDSVKYYPSTEARFAGTVIQQRETFQQMPETEQRVEQVFVEEQRHETPAAVKTPTVVRNVVIPTKTMVRNEPLPQPMPVVEQRFEQTVQRMEPFIPQTPVEIRTEPFQQQTLSVEPFEPFVQTRADPIKSQVVRSVEPAPVKTTYTAPVVKNVAPLKSTFTQAIPQPIATQTAVDDMSVRKTYTQTIAQPKKAFEPAIKYFYPLVQPFIPLSQTAKVIRPSQHSTPVARSTAQSRQFIPVSALKFNYRTVVPQYMRTTPMVYQQAPAQAQTSYYIQV